MKLYNIPIGLIPKQISRHKWRGIFRYGWKKALKCRSIISKNDSKPKYYLSFCAIAKNEGPYFKEWLDWHIKQGVEKFYIYDNDSTDNTKEILQPYIESGIVDYHYFPGPRCQMPAYDECIDTYRFETRWLAFIDLDEFIVPVKTPSLRSFLQQNEQASAIEINWLNYGSGGAEKRLPGDLMQRFRCHSKPDHIINRHVKTIVNPRAVYAMTNAHEAACIHGYPYDSHGEEISQPYNSRPPQHDIVRINHYATKSREEYLARKKNDKLLPFESDWEKIFRSIDLNDIKE